MVVSLYVSEIPIHMDKKDLTEIFKSFHGFIDLRIKTYNDKGKICFVDFDKESDAKLVISSLNGVKYFPNHKGFNLKVSDNSSKRNGSREREASVAYNTSSSKYYHKRSRSRSNSYKRKGRSSPLKYDSSSINPQDVLQTLLNNQNEPLTSSLLNYFTHNQSQNHTQNQGQPHNQSQSLYIQSSKDKDKDKSLSRLFHFESKLKDLISFKKHATNIVFIEGLPIDCSEREVAHILRPFPGYISSRLIEREKNGEKSIICFSDFEEVHQATACIYTLQGYRFDRSNLIGLHLSYGVNKHKSGYYNN